MGNELFQKLIEASELSKIFAARSLCRALERAGVDPEKLTGPSLKGALPEIRKTITPYVEGRADEVMTQIQKLCV